MADSTPTLAFQTIAPFLAMGDNPPAGWRSLRTLPLVILVGVTGVGKSTLLDEMAKHGASYLLLPDRRQLTDSLIISAMQAADGDPVVPVNDRGQRFAYTRRYRELYEGGMAHALTQLWLAQDSPDLLVFDGLRGENEVTYAASELPLARFVMLDAPDIVRLRRLLGRGDAFDRIEVVSSGQLSTGGAATFATLGVPEAANIFNAAEESIIFGWMQHDVVNEADVRAKLQIVIEERRSYDPMATAAALRAHAEGATLYVDTVTYGPEAVAGQVISWLNQH